MWHAPHCPGGRTYGRRRTCSPTRRSGRPRPSRSPCPCRCWPPPCAHERVGSGVGAAGWPGCTCRPSPRDAAAHLQMTASPALHRSSTLFPSFASSTTAARAPARAVPEVGQRAGLTHAATLAVRPRPPAGRRLTVDDVCCAAVLGHHLRLHAGMGRGRDRPHTHAHARRPPSLGRRQRQRRMGDPASRC